MECNFCFCKAKNTEKRKLYLFNNQQSSLKFYKIAIFVLIILNQNECQAAQFESSLYPFTGYTNMKKEGIGSVYNWYSSINSNVWMLTFDDEYCIDTLIVVSDNDTLLFEITLFSHDQKIQQDAGRNLSPQRKDMLNKKYYYDYKFTPIKAKSMKIKLVDVFFYVEVYVTALQKSSYFLQSNESQYQISEASYYSSGQSFTLKQLQSLLNTSSRSYLTIRPQTTVFDISPIAWFTVKLKKVQLVHQFIIASGNDMNSVGKVKVYFRLNYDRDFTEYTENNITKIFINNYVPLQWFCHNLKSPFMASEIQVLLDSENPLMYFTMDFRFIESMEYKYEKPVIGLFNILAEDIIRIKFNKSFFISGIMFDSINNLLKFCISYDVNNEFVPYSDNKLFDEKVKFKVFSEISFRPFRTTEILLSELEWFMTSSRKITVTVNGDNYLSADYTWTNLNFISYNAYDEYTNTKGSQTLYGNSKYLQKSNLRSKLMSDYLGPDCFTQPHLCVSGFTIQLEVDELLSEDLVKTFYLSDQLVDKNSDSGKMFLFFNDFYLPSNARVKDFYLKIGTIKFTENFKARIYLIFVPEDEILNGIKKLLYENKINQITNDSEVFMFNGPFGTTQLFNLTFLLKKLQAQYNGLLKRLCIMVLPQNQTFTNNPDDVKLLITYSNTVIGDVRILNPLMENKFFDLFNNIINVYFDQTYCFTGIHLHTKSPVDVDIFLQVKYSDTICSFINCTLYITLKKVFIKGGENKYVALNGLIKTKHFRIILSKEVVLHYQFYGSEKTFRAFPILSAGLGGHQNFTHGNGFQIHLVDNKITATVVSIYGRYNVAMEKPSVTPYTLTLVWSKQSLKFFYNNELKDFGNLLKNVNYQNYTQFNEYILVFADYYNVESELQAKLLKIQMWNIPLTEDEISETLFNATPNGYSYPESFLPEGFTNGSDCYCSNQVCPCETLETSSTVEIISKHAPFEIVSEDDFIEEEFYLNIMDYTNNSFRIYFDITFDLQNVQFENVNFVSALKSLVPACYNVVMQISNSSDEVQMKWCISRNITEVFTSPDLTSLLTQLLKAASYTPPVTILLKFNYLFISPESILRIVYKPSKLGGFIYSTASQVSIDDVLEKVLINVSGGCVSFKLKFGGTGFVGLVVIGHGVNVKKRLAYFYRQEAQDKWLENYLDLNSEKFTMVEFIAYKNGLGSGYVAFDKVLFLQSCPIGKAKSAGSIEPDKAYSFSNPVVMVTDTYEFYTALKNASINQGSIGTLLNFFNSYNFLAYHQHMTFKYWPIYDFTILFWFKYVKFPDFIFNMTYTPGNAISVGFNTSSSVFLSYKKLKKNIGVESLLWHHLVIQYERQSYQLSIQIDFKAKVTFNDVQLSGNSSISFWLSYNIICFQVYKEILFPSAIKAVQFCPIKQWDLACTIRRSQCEWCNPFYGRWELLPLDYIINNKMAECMQESFNGKFYQPFNTINNNKFVAEFSDSFEVQSSSEVKLVNGFIYNGLSVANSVAISDASVVKLFTEYCPVFSAWINHRCENEGEDKPILTTSVVTLFCKKKDSSTTVTPVMAVYKECCFDLPGKSGLWYNFVFILNKTVFFYIDGVYINSSCRPALNPQLLSFFSMEIKVFSVATFPTLIDEVLITNNTKPELLFKMQLTGYPSNEKIKQTTTPLVFKFCSSQVWFNDKFLVGSSYYETNLKKIQSEIADLMSSFEEFLLLEVVSLESNVFSKVCGKFNVYLLFQNENIIKINNLKSNFISNIFSENNETYMKDDILEHYSKTVTYNVLHSHKTTIVLSLEIAEDFRYPVSKILVQYGPVNNDTFKKVLVNNAKFIYIDGLELFKEYKVCFSFQTIRKRFFSSCVQQNKTFMTSQGEPTEYPLFNCSLNEEIKTIYCYMSQISYTSWNGIPYAYELVYWVKDLTDSCKDLLINRPKKHKDIIKYNTTSNLRFQIKTTDFHFVELCIIGYATTNGGQGIGIWKETVVRTQREAPEFVPENFTAIVNQNSIQFKWNSLENTIEAWNDYKVPGFYQLSYGIVASSVFKEIVLTTKNISGNEFTLKNIDSCYLLIASVNAFSIASGPKSDLCVLPYLSEPFCMTPLITNFYATSSRSASFITNSFLPTFFRGTNTYWLFHVDVIDENYNPGPPSDEYLRKPVYLTHSLEKFSGKSGQCTQSDFLGYFNQSTSFVLDLLGLHPNTHYQVSVQPCNEIGCGKISNNVEFSTYSDVPSCEPTQIQMQNLSSTSMSISWQRIGFNCAHSDINKISYTLKCFRQDSMLLNENIESTTILLTSLNKYEQLCCEVAASNLNGTGPFSSQSCAYTDEDIPDAPSNISSYSDNTRIIRVAWNAVPFENSYGLITAYEICRVQLYLNGNIGPKYCFKQINSLILEFNITNLDKSSTHNISLAACNKAGCGKRIFIVASSMQIDGEWADWSDWTECSKTCNNGTKSRSRICMTAPMRKHSCSGQSTQKQVCQLEKCLVGNWSMWSTWSDCSKTCNKGVKIRSRTCANNLGKYNCVGVNISYETCLVEHCSGFILGREGVTDCDIICEENNLVCLNSFKKFSNNNFIYFNDTSSILCFDNSPESFYSSDLDPSYNSAIGWCYGYLKIPINVSCKSESVFVSKNMHRICNCVNKGTIDFDEWSEWTFCTATCGTSFMIRNRVCYGNCSGITEEKKNCDVPVCPVDGEWGNWEPYSACNASCHYGYYNRTRKCDSPSVVGGGTPCHGPEIDLVPECSAFPCPVHGGISMWTEWSICSRPCGNGERFKQRYCNNPKPMYNGNECTEPTEISEVCVMPPCRIVGVYLVQRTLEKWLWQMYYNTSNEYQNFAMQFKNSIKEYFLRNNLEGLNDVVINKIRSGSVIVEYMLLFDFLYGQMVEYLDGVSSTGKLMNVAISNTYFSSLDVNCPPPYNISVTYNESAVVVTWLRNKCKSTLLWLYIYLKDQTLEKSFWEWKGVSSNSRELFLNNLAPMHQYKAYMLVAMPNGNSLPSEVFYFEAPGKAPDRKPANITVKSMKSTEIYVEWTDISEQYRNGKILGYKIRYKVYWSNDPLNTVDAQYGFNAFILKALKPFTLYYVDVYGYNLFGAGPSIYSMCKTLEDAPSALVPNIVINDMQSIDWWSVSWDPIPAEYINGVLRGYRLTYYLNSQFGVEVIGEKIRKVINFDPFTRYYKEQNLLNYATYVLSIEAFTSFGNGPVKEFEAKTCKCPENIFTNWYINEPFTSTNDNSLFISLLQEIFFFSCGTCKSYSNKYSTLHFRRSKHGNPIKKSEFELKASIKGDVDLSFPIYGKIDQSFSPNSTFVILLNSPGIAGVVRNENTIESTILRLAIKIFTVWPLLLITFLIASAFGMVIWFVDQFSNPDQFIIGNARKGPLAGIWFALVTMTTVGYGDLVPRSILGRIISMIWFIIGIILNSIIIGFIVTNLTSITNVDDIIMYGTKVAALDGSFERKTVINRNGILPNSSIEGINLITIQTQVKAQVAKVRILANEIHSLLPLLT
ncbi:uncharacterized protein LOC100197582 isoform X2 [Hydra vulgaris]|uniref:uncharacterized protein LOC100197582 isoform X2 n=1 Tax=Hydra vulgaris TaxID=6087 RepID=UPI0032EA0442